MAISLATLQEWLDQALTAEHQLAMGQGVVQVSGPAGTVQFTAAKLPDLQAHIRKLQSWINNGGVPTTASSHRPIFPTF